MKFSTGKSDYFNYNFFHWLYCIFITTIINGFKNIFNDQHAESTTASS